MSSWIFFKVFGDTCLYFSFISALPVLFPCRLEFYLPALACAAGALIADLLAKLRPSLRMLGCLLPLCGLFLAQSATEIFVLLLPIIYTVAVVLKAQYPAYYRYRAFYKKLIILWCCILCIFALFSELLLVLDNLKLFDLTAFAVYGLISLVSGVLLLRSLRLGHLASQSTNRKQLALTAGAFGGFVFIGIISERILIEHGRSIGQFLLSVFKMVLAIPIYILLALMGSPNPSKVKEAEESIVTEITEATEATEETLLLEEPVSEAVKSVSQVAEEGFPWWILIVIMAVLIIILIILFRLHQYRSKELKTDEISERIGNNKKRTAIQISNRNKIRRYYREYLKYQKSQGMKLHTDQTSLDILENSPSRRNSDASKYLREIYISARYDEESDITHQQLNEARNALNKIRQK